MLLFGLMQLRIGLNGIIGECCIDGPSVDIDSFACGCQETWKSDSSSVLLWWSAFLTATVNVQLLVSFAGR